MAHPATTTASNAAPARPRDSEFEPIGQILERVIAAAGCASVLREAAAARSDRTGRVERHEGANRQVTCESQVTHK